MYRVYMPVPDPSEDKYQREWNEDAPWRLAGMTVMMFSAFATTTLYVHLGKMLIAALA